MFFKRDENEKSPCACFAEGPVEWLYNIYRYTLPQQPSGLQQHMEHIIESDRYIKGKRKGDKKSLPVKKAVSIVIYGE